MKLLILIVEIQSLALYDCYVILMHISLAGDTNEDEVIQSAAQALDVCARHLAPDKLLQPLMPAVDAALKSGDDNKVRETCPVLEDRC